MAAGQTARKGADDIGTDDWVAQRRAHVRRLQEAEAAGRKAWAQSSRTGENLSAPTPGDVAALGARIFTENGSAVAGLLGNAVGALRAGVHSAKGIRDEVVLAGRILSPLERVLTPPSQRATQQLTAAADKIVDYGFSAVAHPAIARRDVRHQFDRWNKELNPYATPQANTLGGELVRNFRIGENQGEFLTDAAALALGTGAFKGLTRLAPISQGAEAAKFIEQGFEPELAKYLAEPYNGQGHHSPIPQRLGKRFLPRDLRDSPLNVVKPKNISRGDFYTLHYQVDPGMWTAKLPAKFGGAWSGKALGLPRFGLLGRIWHGTPTALSTAVGTAGLAGLGSDAEGKHQ